MAHLKTFAKWIHKLKPFPLDNPMAKIKLLPVGTGLEVERAITPAERRWNEVCKLAGIEGHTPMAPGTPWVVTLSIKPETSPPYNGN